MSLSPFALLKRIVPDDLKLFARTCYIGGHFRLRTPDRIFLEETVFPWFCDIARVRSVLDVGCDWYTRSYRDLLKADEYLTIDLDPAKARFAKGRETDHRVGSLLELDRHFPPDRFDLALCNGVLGWGIDDAEAIAIAAAQLAGAIRPGGWLVLGWNDSDGHRPATLAPFDTPPLMRFAISVAGNDTVITKTASRHTFRFFRKAPHF